MNKIAKSLIAFTFLSFNYFQSFAQFSVSAEIRPRLELREGFKTLRNSSDDPAFFIEQRTRLYVNYQDEKLTAHIAFQDVRIWGSHSQIYKTDPGLTNIYEGWARYYFSDKWSFKIGRQALDYDNARFLGDLDWAQQGRSHDALLFIYDNSTSQTQLHVGGAFNQFVYEPTKLFGTEYLEIDNYKTMQFAWFHKKSDDANFSLLFQNDGRQVAADTSMAYRQTYGIIGNYNFSKVGVDAELYYQGGKNSSNVNVNAFLAALYATCKTSLTPITLGIEYLSGTSITDTKDKSFQPLYGTNHKFYGCMDYFYVGNGHGQVTGLPAGLLDLYIKTNFKLSESSSLLAHIHNFSSGAKLYAPVSPDNEIPKNLGTEIDLVFNHTLGSNGRLNVGYSTMFATSSMGVAKGRGDHTLGQHWAWVMIAFKPTLFTAKKE